MASQFSYGQQQHKKTGEDGFADKVSEAVKDYADQAYDAGAEAIDRADEYLKPVGLSLKEKPMTTLAVFGGIAFMAGALWMMRGSQRQSRWDGIASQLNDMSRRARWW
jgi:ElaB/YqjD/DUF883 family membrane-anchored ribosome-binding protein